MMIDKECLNCKRYYSGSCNGVEDRKRSRVTIENSCSGFLFLNKEVRYNYMKEKDIVDFSKMEENENGDYIDENGNEVGCEICYTHEKAYEKLKGNGTISDYINLDEVVRCPDCNNIFNIGNYNGNHIVSETNSPTPNGNIGLYPIFYCNHCDKLYALIPEPIEYNANHDIYYTGGRSYIVDDDQQELFKSVFDHIKPSIEQYIRRVVDEKEQGLDMWNIMTWCKYDIEAAIANWLYEHDLKK